MEAQKKTPLRAITSSNNHDCCLLNNSIYNSNDNIFNTGTLKKIQAIAQSKFC